MEHEISPDYLPISPSSLRTNTTVGCDVFLLAKTTAELRFVLYCKGDAVFDEAKKEMLVAQKIKSLFIKKNDQQAFFEYLENNFQDIIADTRIGSDEKAIIVHSAATNLIKDLFDNPRTGNIERTKNYALNMVDYILKEGKAAHNLLRILVHEYYTYTHSVNVAAVGTLFAQSIGVGESELKSFCSGILLHDIGKTRISTDILNKKGKLTKKEYEMIKKHPETGVEILKESGNGVADEYIITLQHHENDDGSGYPHGLKKDEIQLCSKIAHIIDVYDALTTDRSYAKAMRPFSALAEMKENMSNYFDKELFADFINFLGPYDPRKKQSKQDKLYI